LHDEAPPAGCRAGLWLERNAGSGWLVHGPTDTGWITTGLVYNSSWTQAAPTGGWQPLKYRKIGSEVWINGVVVPSVAWSAVIQVISGLPAPILPSTPFEGMADYLADVTSGFGVRMRSGSGSAGIAVAINLHYVVG
jgi:hypothetical protein